MKKSSAVTVFAAASVLALGLFIGAGSAKACPPSACSVAPAPAAPVSTPSVAYSVLAPSLLSFDNDTRATQVPADRVEGNANAVDSGLAAFVGPWGAKAGFVSATVGTVGIAGGTRLAVDLAGDNLIAVAVAVSDKVQAHAGRMLLTTHAAKNIVDGAVNMSGAANATRFSAANGAIVLGQ